MSVKKKSFFWQFFIQKGTILLFTVLSLGFILLVVGFLLSKSEERVEAIVNIGESIVFAGIVGGIISLGFNLLYEEVKREEDTRQAAAEKLQEQRGNYKQERTRLVKKLQEIHDRIETARILIRSHKSAKTYGEQIRQKVIPAYITLLEIKRNIKDSKDYLLTNQDFKIPHLRVGIHFMLAYIAALLLEYENHYLRISHLQHYQEELSAQVRNSFLAALQKDLEKGLFSKDKEIFLTKAEESFFNKDIPSPIKIVWKEIQKMPFIMDYIGTLQSNAKEDSSYNQYFLQYYEYCKGILQPGYKKCAIEVSKEFESYVRKLEGLDQLKQEQPNSEQIFSLTELIMEKELTGLLETNA